MKKIILLGFLLVVILGCKEDLVFNTPAFDAVKNNEPWRADGFVAYNNEDGGYSIKGDLGVESVILNIDAAVEGQYVLNSGTSASAVYTDATGTVYSTKNTPKPSLTLYPAGGKIFVDDVTEVDITGRFQFSAFTEDGLQGVTFSGNANNLFDAERYGVFYKINRVGSTVNLPTNQFTCVSNVLNSMNASVALSSASPTDSNYSTLCETYAQSLTTVTNTCDGDDKLRAQIDLTNLNDCLPSNICDIALEVAVEQKARFEAASTTDPDYDIFCNNYKNSLERVFSLCTGTDSANAQAELLTLMCM